MAEQNGPERSVCRMEKDPNEVIKYIQSHKFGPRSRLEAIQQGRHQEASPKPKSLAILCTCDPDGMLRSTHANMTPPQGDWMCTHAYRGECACAAPRSPPPPLQQRGCWVYSLPSPCTLMTDSRASLFQPESEEQKGRRGTTQSTALLLMVKINKSEMYVVFQNELAGHDWQSDAGSETEKPGRIFSSLQLHIPIIRPSIT